ncbi:hypothetical protein LJR230_002122 [Trinickia sp. LjRoot230]|uniref:hypothetical protein n=1 Tax=Trinickia sp. LjRoot230 TaxID=3342288 RepID=UPI003ED0556B
MVESANTFRGLGDRFSEPEVPDGASGACASRDAIGPEDATLVTDDFPDGDAVLRGLNRLTLKVDRNHRNHWLSGMRRSGLPTEPRGTGEDGGDKPIVIAGRLYKLTLPMREIGAIAAAERSHNAPASCSANLPAEKWAVTAAVGDFLRNKEIGLLDFTRCDPESEVLHNLFGTEISEACPYVSGPIKEFAKCVKFPHGMKSVPTWIELLFEIEDITLEGYQGECIVINNRYLRQLNASGPRLREIHVSETTQVRCRERGVSVHRKPRR